MAFQRPHILPIGLALVSLGLVLYAYANPGVAACAFADSDLKPPARFEKLLSESRGRIQNTFGTPQAKPIVVFFNEPATFWPLKLNEYGSTQFLGAKVCVMVGPKGQNLDVVAHELLHAEIASRLGYWRRFTQLPVWFDEGLAMQVDYRPRYDMRSDPGATGYVKTLWSAADFFVADDEALTQNYAAAKAEVARWVAEVGNSSVYRQLERIGHGETFEAVFNGE